MNNLGESFLQEDRSVLAAISEWLLATVMSGIPSLANSCISQT